MPVKEPFPACPAAEKHLDGGEPGGEPMGLQHRTRRFELVFFREHEGVQQLIMYYCAVAFGEALQEDPRALPLPIEERGGGGVTAAWLTGASCGGGGAGGGTRPAISPSRCGPTR